MRRVGLIAGLATLVALSTTNGGVLRAQSAPGEDSLRRQVERRFDIRATRTGVLLLPKGDDRRVRLIEITDAAIAIDGLPVSGPELRTRLGADADLVLKVSYLDADARRQLADGATAAPPAPPPQAERDPAEPAPDQPSDSRTERERRRERRSRGNNDDDRIGFGSSVSVAEGERIDGDVVAILGSTRVDGEVTGNAVAVLGTLTLGPHAYVHGDAVSVGGPLRREEGSRVDGKIVDAGARGLEGRWNWGRFGRMAPFGVPFLGAAAGIFALMSTIIRVAVLCLLTCIVLFVGRDYVERVGARAAAEPLKAGAIGVLAQLLFVPVLVLTIIVFVITIIGIPLLVLIPFALLALALVFLVGFTAVSYNVGQFAKGRFAWRTDSPYLTAVIGIVMLVSPVLIARLLGLADWLLFPVTGALVFVGVLAEYVAWTVGLGAVALLRFTRPPAPPPAAA